MTRHFKYLLLTLAFGLCSCNRHPIDSKSTSIDSIKVDTSDLSILNAPIVSDGDLGDTSTTIKFNEITIKLSRLIPFDEHNSLNQIQQDSCYIIADIGETIVGGQLTISSNILTDLKVEQRYETSVSISNEGPHCDLTDWKHFLSDWQSLKPEHLDTYKCLNYTDNEKEKFPQIDINELKSRVKTQCGDEWYELVKNITRPTQDPSWVGISRIYLRVTGKLKGKSITKIIVIEEAMGC